MIDQSYQEWSAAYLKLVKGWTGKKKARIGTKKYPWNSQIALTEDGDAPIKVEAAVVLNLASALLEGRPDLNEGRLLEGVSQKLLAMPQCAELNNATDGHGRSCTAQENVAAVVDALKHALPQRWLELLQAVSQTGAAGDAAASPAGTGAAAAAAGMAGTAAAAAAAAASGATAAAAAAATGTTAAAAEAGPGMQAASRKRPLTEVQLSNLTGKECRDCGQKIPSRTTTCSHCNSKQVPKSEQQKQEPLAPLKPYNGIGPLPPAQNSKQSLSNVGKQLQCPALLKQLRHAADQTGFELVTTSIGVVKCGAAYDNISALHRPGIFVMPVGTGLPEHRLVVHTHSTGGPVRDAMEKPCAIAGFQDPSIPQDIKSVRTSTQALATLWHQGMAAAAAVGAAAGAEAARAAAEGAGATAGATAAAAAAGAAAEGAGAAAGVTAAAAAAAGAAAADTAGADPGGAAATAAMRQPAASQPAGDAGIPAAPAAATPAPMQPAQAGNLAVNMPTTMEFLVRELTETGYTVMDDAAVVSIAPSLRDQVVALRTQGCPAQVVFKCSDVGVAAVAPVLSIATGMMSVYHITDAGGSRYVQVPQLVPQPNSPWLQAALRATAGALALLLA